MSVRRRTAWSLEELVLRQSSVQGKIIDHIMADISEGLNTQKIRAGSIKTTEYIESEGFVSGSVGWHIDGDGNAEFNNIIIRDSLFIMPSGTTFPVSPEDGELFLRTDENIAYRYDLGNTEWLPLDFLASGARIANAIIDTAQINDLAVENAKIGLLSVDTAQIALLAVDTAQIANLAVDTAQIAAAAITNAKIDALAVDTAEIANLAVDTAQIANLAVDTAQIASAAITNAKIDNLAVDTAEIANAAITTAKIDNLAVETAKIDLLAVDTAQIANLAVETAKIDNLAVTNAKIGDLSADKITAGTIDTGEIVVESDITMDGDGFIQTAPSGTARIRLGTSANQERIQWVSSGNSVEADMYVVAGSLQIRYLNLYSISIVSSGGVNTTGRLTSSIEFQPPAILVGFGSAANPSHSFSVDPDTGMYRINTNRLGFATAGVFEWEITSAGNFVNVLAGSSSASNTTPRTHLGVPGGLNIFTKSSGQTIIAGRSGSDGGIIDFRNDGTQVGTISVSGSATAYNTSSDESLKDNVRPFASSLALIRSLPVREWEWKGNGDHGVGFVAQEVFPLLPDITSPPDAALDDNDEEFWGIDYGRLSPWNTRAIQELADLVDELRSEIEVLKAA